MADVDDDAQLEAEVQAMMARTKKTGVGGDDDLEAEVQAMMARTDKKTKKKTKKKQKKTKKKQQETKQKAAAPVVAGYPYEMLLKRVYAFIERDNPAQLQRHQNKRLRLPAFNMCRYKTTRTIWSNFSEVCSIMDRPLDHVLAFLERELAVRASISRSSSLVLPTRIESRRMGQIMNTYVTDYVLCPRCKSYRTSMHKNRVQRITYVTCLDCQAETAAKPIRAHNTGHKALKRGDRRRARCGLDPK
jgi:translation initiation factor 2 subunit 2